MPTKGTFFGILRLTTYNSTEYQGILKEILDHLERKQNDILQAISATFTIGTCFFFNEINLLILIAYRQTRKSNLQDLISSLGPSIGCHQG